MDERIAIQRLKEKCAANGFEFVEHDVIWNRRKDGLVCALYKAGGQCFGIAWAAKHG